MLEKRKFTEIPDGSLLLYRGDSSFVSRLIRFIRRSPYTHAALKLRDFEYTQADGVDLLFGVNTLHYSGLAIERSGEWDVFTPKWAIPKDMLIDMEKEARRKEGVPYDYLGLMEELVKFWNFRWLWFFNSQHKYYCSEWCHYLFAYGQKDRRVLVKCSYDMKLHQKAPDELPGTFWNREPSYSLILKK